MANEKRLICLDETLEATHREIYWTESEQAAVRSFLVKQPKVDAAEVVRCKDCVHCEVTPDCLRWCNVWNGINGMGDEGFCNYGERKDNAHK